MVSVEVQEIVEAGMSGQAEGLIGESTEDLVRAIGSGWIPIDDEKAGVEPDVLAMFSAVNFDCYRSSYGDA